MGFAKILGQEPAVQGLRHAFEKNRVSHAYLFEGPEGVGKKTTALAFAELLLCQEPVGSEACGVCNSCHMMAAGMHPDLIIVAPDGKSIKIKQIRELRTRLGVSSRQGGYTVVVIEAADTMGIEAANALLKTIEEPQGPTVFLLLATSMRLPQTILSRVQRIHFRPLSEKVLVRLLGEDDERAQMAARLSRGSLTRARALLADEAAWEEKRARQEALEEKLASLTSTHPGHLVSYADTLMGKREEALEAVVMVRAWLEKRLRHDLTMGRDVGALLAATQDTTKALERLETNTEPAFIMGALFIEMSAHLRQ